MGIRFKNLNISFSIAAYSMTQWISFYRNCQKDRVHHFRCRPGPAYYSDCSWTPHLLHDATHPLHYRCPDDGFITGVHSHFVKASKDRRYEAFLTKITRKKGITHSLKEKNHFLSIGIMLRWISFSAV